MILTLKDLKRLQVTTGRWVEAQPLLNSVFQTLQAAWKKQDEALERYCADMNTLITERDALAEKVERVKELSQRLQTFYQSPPVWEIPKVVKAFIKDLDAALGEEVQYED